MNFKFVRAELVRAVVSCKSQLDSIDSDYPKALKKFGIGKQLQLVPQRNVPPQFRQYA
jgi:hypothetical protein